MKVIAVVGSASGSGKTKLACAILGAIPGLGAVKISPRGGRPRVEWGAGGAGKDTSRYAASGASLVARIVGPRERVIEAWAGVRGSLDRLRGVVVEGAGALALPAERFTILVVAPESLGERPERDARLAASADFVVVVQTEGAPDADGTNGFVHLAERVPVVRVSQGNEDWADESLFEAVRGFLLGSGKPDRR